MTILNNDEKTTLKKPLRLNNGYRGTNFYADSETQKRIRESDAVKRAKREKEFNHAYKNIQSRAAGPIGGIASELTKNSPSVKKIKEKYVEAPTPEQGIEEGTKEAIKIALRKKLLKYALPCLLFLFFLIFLVSFFFENADSQIYSNENGGTVISDDYIEGNTLVNVFANYPGLYEKIEETVKKVSNEYKVDIDKYLIIATLISPINNSLITPVDDNSCGEEKCYYFKGESKTWTKFVESWGDQAELLAKMQILTYTNNAGLIKAKCGKEDTMEQYAQNDYEIVNVPWYGWVNPENWFKGFKDATTSEINAKCVEAKNGSSIVPDVRVLSIEQGTYYFTNNAKGEYEFVKDPKSGGVYFWNLVNKNGFLHEYLKDYLSDEKSDNPDENYEINKKTIVDTANDIYLYYESIKKDCNGLQVIQGDLKKINFREDGHSPIYSLDFEEIFIGGNLLATFPGAKGEVAKAQAILTRSEAYYNIAHGAKQITGTAVMGCWWWKYNPTYDPSYEDQKDNPNYDPDYPKTHWPAIYEAVTSTKGIVVTPYGGTDVLETQWDSFCPQTREAQGGFYYLPDGQRDLPIEVARFAVPLNRVECPCFKNRSSRPDKEYAQSLIDLLNKRIGTPAQTTTEKCWTEVGTKRDVDELGNVTFLKEFEYETTGGHGQGASQHGMAYFSQFGYDHEALIKLFFERNNYGVTLKKFEEAIEDGECDNYNLYKNDGANNGGNGGENYNNDSDIIGGTPLTKPIEQALKEQGHTINDLNSCIGDRVKSSGMGTRAGVVEAGMGLIQCTKELTGGYVYSYEHHGGAVMAKNPDIVNKLGINSRWGMPGGACEETAPKCYVGLNCANFVRWSFCNGGMNLCDRGSSYAKGMFSNNYYPGAINIELTPSFKVVGGNTSIKSSAEAFDNIKPGDVLYSVRRNNGSESGNHVMLIVGKDANSITIAENGKGTRRISKKELTTKTARSYSVFLLDDYYANSNNKNNLVW